MPRVLYLTHIGRLSGGEIALARMIAALRGSDVDAFVLLGESGPLVQHLEAAGATVEVLPLDPRVRDLRKEKVWGPLSSIRQITAVMRHAAAVRQRIVALQIDLVHSNSLKSGFYGGLAAKRAGVPLVWHLRDRLSPDYLPPYAILLLRCAIFLLASRAVCNSQSTMSTLTRWPFGFLARRTRSISSPPPDLFSSSSTAMHQDPTDAEPAVKFVMVGRLAPWKGQHVALAAFEKASMTNATLTFVGSSMFGEDHYASDLKGRIRASPLAEQIVMLGFQDEVASTLHRYDVLVHASISPEPFGQVIIEGLAAGLAVVAARAGGPAEIITDGVDGLLHTPGDIHDLARHLDMLYQDRRLRITLSGRGRLRAAEFSPETVAGQVQDVYAACLSRDRGQQRRQCPRQGTSKSTQSPSADRGGS